MLPASPALAAIHTEPSNALSLPTWAIHISSTVEWGTAMYLFWRYAEVTGTSADHEIVIILALIHLHTKIILLSRHSNHQR